MQRRAGHGFTLIELLVVVSIIALLIALLLPALASARASAKAARCLGTLRQYATANASYVADFDGWNVPARDPDTGDAWLRNEYFRELLGRWQPNGGQTWRYGPSSVVCPAADLAFEDVRLGNPHRGSPSVDNSYAANRAGGAGGGPAFGKVRLETIERPTDKVQFMDHVEDWQTWWSNSAVERYLALGERPGAARVAYRHLGSGNFLFFDGHVAATPPASIGAPTVATPAAGHPNYERHWRVVQN